jgi:hypothetical protein
MQGKRLRKRSMTKRRGRLWGRLCGGRRSILLLVCLDESLFLGSQLASGHVYKLTEPCLHIIKFRPHTWCVWCLHVII